LKAALICGASDILGAFIFKRLKDEGRWGRVPIDEKKLLMVND